MIRCTGKVLWVFVVAIIVTNLLLLLKYRALLESTESSSRNRLVRTNDATKPPRPANGLPPKPEHRDQQAGATTPATAPKQALDSNNNKQKNNDDHASSALYQGPIVNDRVAIPEISATSRSPYGRMLFRHGINLVPSGAAASSATATLRSTQSSYDEETNDVVDLLLAKTLPLRYWRLDPLVPEAARLDKQALHKQDASYAIALHHVKHQAAVLKFRWPWHLSHHNEKLTRVWIESADERARVSVKVFTAWRPVASSSSSSPSSLAKDIETALRTYTVLPDNVVSELEAIIERDGALPVFARRVLSSRLRAHKILKNTGCNVLRVPFTSPTEDDACTAYLADTRNWKTLKPLPARYDARTIKFQVEFNEPELHSVLKVPQRLFPYEAFAEIGAYHADRVLGVRRIPPTAYVCIPKAMIRETVKRDGKTVETDDETLKESGVKTYEEWVEKDLLSFAKKSAYNADDHGDCVGASIQPLLADVHHLLDSALAVPYKTHDKTWHDYFNFTVPTSAADDQQSNSEKKSKPKKIAGPFGEPVETGGGGENDKESDTESDLPIRFLRAPYAPSILHMAEVVVFDYIVGNNDRSPNKNFFVVGSCVDDASVCSEDETSFFQVKPGDENAADDVARQQEEQKQQQQTAGDGGDGGGGAAVVKSVEQVQRIDWHSDKSALRRPGVPSFVHIDQGMAFYQTPSDNALTKALKKGDPRGFCLFRRRLINRILDLFGAEAETLSNGQDKESFLQMVQRVAVDDDANHGGNNNDQGAGVGFTKLMQMRAPPRAMHAAVLSKEHFKSCEHRMRKVLLQLARCLGAGFTVEQVVAP